MKDAGKHQVSMCKALNKGFFTENFGSKFLNEFPLNYPFHLFFIP